jgi:hypothetical protein
MSSGQDNSKHIGIEDGSTAYCIRCGSHDSSGGALQETMMVAQYVNAPCSVTVTISALDDCKGILPKAVPSARLRSAGVGLSLDKTHYTSLEVCESIASIVGDHDGKFAHDVKRMKGIAKIASRRKHLAADMIEQSIIDEEYRFLNDRKMHPRYLQTADMRMSTWKANNWDLRLLALGGSFVVVASMSYIGRTIYAALRVRTGMIRT